MEFFKYKLTEKDKEYCLFHAKNGCMMNQKEWLERATKFDLGTCIFYNRPIVIEARGQMDGSIKWVLKMHEWVLGKDGDFHYEPLPSSRTDEFINNTRFNTPDECHSFWVENVNAEKPLYRRGN